MLRPARRGRIRGLDIPETWITAGALVITGPGIESSGSHIKATLISPMFRTPDAKPDEVRVYS
jgi:hypothetical protein